LNELVRLHRRSILRASNSKKKRGPLETFVLDTPSQVVCHSSQ
jgi:hypothetical protein